MDFHCCAGTIVEPPTTAHSGDCSFLGGLFSSVRNDTVAPGDFLFGGLNVYMVADRTNHWHDGHFLSTKHVAHGRAIISTPFAPTKRSVEPQGHKSITLPPGLVTDGSQNLSLVPNKNDLVDHPHRLKRRSRSELLTTSVWLVAWTSWLGKRSREH